jgi:hypothetical protein
LKSQESFVHDYADKKGWNCGQPSKVKTTPAVIRTWIPRLNRGMTEERVDSCVTKRDGALQFFRIYDISLLHLATLDIFDDIYNLTLWQFPRGFMILCFE